MATKFGTKGIVKKMFGTKEVLKEVFDGSVVYTNTPPVEYFVTFSSPNTFTIATYNTTKNWDGSLYYSTDTQHWNTWNGTSTLHSSSTGDTKYLYMKGSNNSLLTGNDTTHRWVVTGSHIKISGEFDTLFDFDSVMNDIPVNKSAYACYCIFAYNENLGIEDCSDLILSKTLSNSCYRGMFYRQSRQYTGLVYPPQLPAHVMYPNCYRTMFINNGSLLTIPKLNITVFDTECCKGMFENDDHITQLPRFTAINYVTSCCDSMFRGCSLIKLSEVQTGEYQTPYRIPEAGTGTMTGSPFLYMFAGTGGTWAGQNYLANTTLYTSNEIVY